LLATVPGAPITLRTELSYVWNKPFLPDKRIENSCHPNLYPPTNCSPLQQNNGISTCTLVRVNIVSFVKNLSYDDIVEE